MTTPASKAPKLRRIALLGSRAVGKSAIAIRYVENVFVDPYFPTIERNFTKRVSFSGQDYDLEILDTAGQDEFSIFNGKHALDMHGYVLVYSITSHASFDMISVIRDKILNYTGTDWLPMVLVGNKSDLEYQRQVTKEEVQALATEWRCHFCETSAKANDNIGRLFEMTLAEIERSSGSVEGEKEDKCTFL